MNKKIWALGILTFAIVVEGCSHAELNEQLDEKLAHQPTVSSSADLANDARALIAASKNLTPEQKKQLTDLSETSQKKGADLRELSLKLRAILVKDIAQTNYDQDEVDLIKSRLKKVEDQRLENIFHSVQLANQILGRRALSDKEEDEKILNLMQIEGQKYE